MTIKQILAELKRLATDARDNIYRRAELAALALDNQDWIVREYDGCERKARDALSLEYFPDLDGYVSLGKIVEVWRNFPKARWAEYRYNVAAVVAAYNKEHTAIDRHEKGTRTNWKSVAEARGLDLEHAQDTVKSLRACADQQLSEIEQLRQQIVELERENARLRGRIEELEKQAYQTA